MGKSRSKQKVAYAVLHGRTPGVYDTWEETERQVKGFAGANFRGYAAREGGRKKAEKDYKEHVKGQPGIDDLASGANNGFGKPSRKQLGTKEAKNENRECVKDERSIPKHSKQNKSRRGAEPTFMENQAEALFDYPCPPGPEARQVAAQQALQDLVLNYGYGRQPDVHAAEKTLLVEGEREKQGKRQREHAQGAFPKEGRKSPRLNYPPYQPVPKEGDLVQQYRHRTSPVNHKQLEIITPPAHGCYGRYASPDRSVEEAVHKGDDTIVNLEDGELCANFQDAKPTAYDSSPASTDYGDVPDYPVLTPPLPPPPPAATEPELCKEQADLVNLIVGGANVFYTGSAGCGKSTVLRSFVRQLKDKGKIVKIIAPTGRAALDVTGTTFWTYAGWHPDSMKVPLDRLEHNARWLEHVNERLCETNVLVIDEISMFENHHFERLNRIMKAARNNERKFGKDGALRNHETPFGGVQLVVTGDFCQLPPVRPFQFCMHCGKALASRGEESYTCINHGEFLDVDKWTFRSAAWKECNFVHVNLKQIHRQSDKEFITILDKFRFGRPLSIADKQLLLYHPSEATNAVKLFPLVGQVREVNGEEFARLPGPTVSFDCLDDYFWNKEQETLGKWFQFNEDRRSLKYLDNHRYERHLQLRPKMLVVLLVNLDIGRGLVNGSQGVVLGFKTHDPAMLPDQPGEYGARRKEQIKKFIEQAPVKQWPLVRFHNGVTRLIKAHCAISELGESMPYSLISRTQIPLLAAWAMTIHKSQGMTLSRVDVDISKVFEKGQAYVALSRATSLHGLKVRALGDCNQGSNEQVMEFLEDKFGKDVIQGMATGD